LNDQLGMLARNGRVPTFRRTALLALLAPLAALAAAGPAAATTQAPPEYSLSIVEGVSTLPEESIVHTSASVHPHAQIVLSIVRNNTIVARDSGAENVWLSQVPILGDVVTVQSPPGNTVGSVIYDGLPSMDPAVCAGSVDFSGQRSAGQPVEGGYYTLVLHTDPYGHSSVRRTASGQAQVTALSGTAFGGSFLTPLAPGQTVWASESLQTPLAGGASFTYSSENDRPVGACPIPPAPPAPPPPPGPLQGRLARLAVAKIAKLLKGGWVNLVTINQPGTVVQDLYLQNGTLPALAAAARHKHGRHHRPPALLLARGSASATSAGTVSVTLHVTAKGRRALKHARRARAVLITTLRSGSGATLTLGRHTVTLHR
jgi:hypothetical protein